MFVYVSFRKRLPIYPQRGYFSIRTFFLKVPPHTQVLHPHRLTTSLFITTRQTSSAKLTNTRQTALNELTLLFLRNVYAICFSESSFYFQGSKAPLPPAIGYYGTLPTQYLPANRTQTLPHSASMRTYSPTHATDRQKSQTLPPGGGRFVLKVNVC